jgi:branched-chain amino acid transport system ATP-binding protein
LLQVEKLNVKYGQMQVLWDITLEIERGEAVTLIGPNGAGKSTLLKAIMGVTPPSSGTIKLNGERIDGMKTFQILEKGLVYVPERTWLFSRMTVEENLELGAITNKRTKDAALEYCFELFPLLKQRRKQLAGTLSGGEMQMLAIARGLMANAKMLMIDEPSLGLSPKATYEVFEAIKKINERGVSILLVEQNIEALNISRRTYVMERGKIMLEGLSREIKQHPHISKIYLGYFKGIK